MIYKMKTAPADIKTGVTTESGITGAGEAVSEATTPNNSIAQDGEKYNSNYIAPTESGDTTAKTDPAALVLQQQYQTEITAALEAGDYRQALKLFNEFGNPNLRTLNEVQTLKAFGDYAAAMGCYVSLEAPGTDETLAAFEERYQNAIENAAKDGKIKLDNISVRKWYIDRVTKIPDEIDRTLSMDKRAYLAFEARNKIRKEARNMMADERERQKLDAERPNKTFEELIESKMKRKGMTREEAIEDIYKTATKTNERVNKELGIEGE